MHAQERQTNRERQRRLPHAVTLEQGARGAAPGAVLVVGVLGQMLTTQVETADGSVGPLNKMLQRVRRV